MVIWLLNGRVVVIWDRLWSPRFTVREGQKMDQAGVVNSLMVTSRSEDLVAYCDVRCDTHYNMACDVLWLCMWHAVTLHVTRCDKACALRMKEVWVKYSGTRVECHFKDTGRNVNHYRIQQPLLLCAGDYIGEKIGALMDLLIVQDKTIDSCLIDILHRSNLWPYNIYQLRGMITFH